MVRELTSLPVTKKQLLPLTTFRHTRKRCGDVVLHHEYITAEPQTCAEGRQWCILQDSDGRSSMKTAIVELDAGGRGSHGQSKYSSFWPRESLWVVAGICGASAGPCWTTLDIAEHSGTLRDQAGHAGLDWPIAHDRPLHDSKKWAPLWKLGGDAHHYRFFLGGRASTRYLVHTLVRTIVRIVRTTYVQYYNRCKKVHKSTAPSSILILIEH
jgi:hypothetical protein